MKNVSWTDTVLLKETAGVPWGSADATKVMLWADPGQSTAGNPGSTEPIDKNLLHSPCANSVLSPQPMVAISSLVLKLSDLF
jgi:hypothetical protein